MLSITLSNLIAGVGVGAVPNLRNPYQPILYIPPTPFLLQLSFLPTQLSLINHIFSMKSELNHTGVNITCFLSRRKIFINKNKKCFWKHLIEPVNHLSWRFLEKTLTAYSRKKFS